MPDQITNIYQLFQKFPWSTFLDINEENNHIKIADSEEYILMKEQGFMKINFYDFDTIERSIIKRENYLTLLIHEDLNALDFIKYWSNEERNSFGYNFSKEHWIFKKIFEGIDIVKISANYKTELQKRAKNLLIQPEKFKEVQAEITKIDKRAKSSKTSLLNFLINQTKFTFLNKRTQKTTSITKGEFDFLINRLNLNTKKKKKDFQQYLNPDDITSLGSLFEEMIKKEVFDEEYLRKLDDYFIKEKLEDIIQAGKEILALKSSNVKTKQAKKLIKLHFSENIGQLETVWQKYFEKYLLYLFFSYKKIIPKVELKDLENLDKKYPDFVGVNHYDGVDIIEIKTHLKNVLVWDNSHDNFAFSSEMSKAIIQSINYMDAITDEKFKKTKDKKDLLSYLNIDQNLYRPRGIIIISSYGKICKNQNILSEDQKKRLKKDFTKLRNSIHNIQIFTFDEILNMAERYVENIKT
ncbi:MAG: DUF4263 domain-containing protein [bacterium]|nr:DUF4263 domain-containing protein [bacterium]